MRNDRDKRASRVAHYVKTHDARALAAMLVAVEDRERRARRRVRKMSTAIRQIATGADEPVRSAEALTEAAFGILLRQTTVTHAALLAENRRLTSLVDERAEKAAVSDSMPCGCGCGLTRGGHRGVA